MLAAALAFLAAQAVEAPVERLLLTVPEEYASLKVHPSFAPNGARAAVRVDLEDGRSLIVLDGTISAPHAYVSAPVFSDDGAHVAWAWGDRKGKDREEWEILVNGKRLKKWDWVGPIVFQPGGSEVAYFAANDIKLGREGYYEGGDYACVWGKKKEDGFSDAGWQAPQWTADGKKIAFLASKPGGAIVHVDGKNFGPFPWASGLTWSADGKDAAWGCVDSSFKSRIWIGKKSFGEGYDAVGAPALGPGGALAYLASVRGKFALVFRDELMPGTYDDLGTPCISPDGKRVAVAANQGRKQEEYGMSWVAPAWMDGAEVWREAEDDASVCFLVADGKKVGADWQRVVLPFFSPDSRHVAARVRGADGWHLVVDERASPVYDAVGSPRFAPDGAAIEFGARRGREVLWVRWPVP